MKRLSPWFVAAAFAPTLAACSSSPSPSDGTTFNPFAPEERFDVVLDGASAADSDAFVDNDAIFGTALFPGDGLGPLYTRTSCVECHKDGMRGPGLVQKMVAVDADGVTPSADQSLFPYGHTVHPLLAGGGKTPIVPPANAPNVKVTIRIGPPILGRGYMEAVTDAEIERVAADQAARTDAIHGRVNYVTYTSQPNPVTTFHTHQPGDRVIGRFGLKARIAAVDDFAADALQGDMGITSPLRPTEIPNPDGLTDDLKPGVDVTIDSVNARATYVRMTAIPVRVDAGARGKQLFSDAKCDVCHVPTLKTRADYPIAQLANIDAPVYTDILLHDLGDTDADGMVEGLAGPRDWRTAPLIGLRFIQHGFMHDGRAPDIATAIAAHAGPGSEANDSVTTFDALTDADKTALVAFVHSL
jgi:CxxC motif-containing protein (DUF1111 family)